MPGLPQTPEYLQVLLRNTSPLADDENMTHEPTTRLERCSILRRDRPPKFFAILDKSALRRPIGGPEVMRGELDHLVSLNETRRAVITIIPHIVGFHRGLTGAFIFAGFDGSEPEVLYCESNVRWLSAEALPIRLSTELIKDIAAAWT